MYSGLEKKDQSGPFLISIILLEYLLPKARKDGSHMTQTRNRNQTLRICFIGMMAAIIFVLYYFRIPFMGTSLHLTNSLCVLAGLLFGPAAGFIAAGIGSFLFDIVSGYGIESLITFVSKGAIGLIAGFIGYSAAHRDSISSKNHFTIVLASVLGAFAYVLLYMLKTFVMGLTVRGLTMDATIASMLSKLPGSVINAIFASIIAPVFFNAIRPALRHIGIWEHF